MSTEATGGGQPDAVGVAKPDAEADAAEPRATAVAEPAAAERTAWATGELTAWDVTEPESADALTDEVPPADGDAEPGEAVGSVADSEPGETDRSAESGEPDEGDEQNESDLGDDEDESDEAEDYEEAAEDYEEYADDDVSAAEPSRARRWPRALLALGFLGLAVIIIGGAIAIVGSLTHGFKKPVKITYKTSAVFSLKTGDCFDPQGQQSYTLISCDLPHQAEVFATFALSGTKWPGAAAAQAQASGGCASRLTAYVNPQLAISLTSSYVYPDSVAWQAGTRSVICEVRASSGELTGSVRGASASAD